LVGGDRKQVTGRPGQQDVGAEELAELRDGVLERRHRGLRGLLAPDLVHEPLGGDRRVRAQKQECEQRALVAAGDRDRSAVCRHLERSEDAEVEEHLYGL